jgi:ATP-binding cassette subfamily C protein CydC
MRGDTKLLLRLLALARPYRGWLALGALCAIVTDLASVGLMAVAGWFIAAMALAGAAGTLVNYVLPAALIRLFAILRAGGRYLERLTTHEATFRLLAGLRTWFFGRIEPLAPARLDEHRASDLLERIQTDVDTLQNAYLRLVVPAVVAMAGIAVAAIVIDRVLPQAVILVVGLMLVAGVVVPALALRFGETPGILRVEARAALRRSVIEGLQGMAELEVCGAASTRALAIDALTRELNREQLRLARHSGFAVAAVDGCASLALWGTALIGAAMLARGSLAPEALLLLTLFVLASFDAIAPLPGALQRAGETFAAARRVFELTDATPAITEPAAVSPVPHDCGITLRGVRMRYGADGPWALDGIDLDLPAGQRVALVGPSGAGKSSIVRLLVRFNAYQEGEVRFGGHDLQRYRSEDLRRRIAVVSQDTWLFDTTLAANLRVADPGADDEQLQRAARSAQIHDFIARLPAGYQTLAGEAGIGLSGGEARRIAIARALLKDAPVLLLDEPTEGLDAQTRNAVLEALDYLMTGRTVLVITHQPLGLCERVDRVLVIERGRVVESGTHAELLQRSRRYARYCDALDEAPSPC